VAVTDNLCTLLVTSSVEFMLHGKECVIKLSVQFKSFQ